MPAKGLRGLDEGETAALIVAECQRGNVDVEVGGTGGLAEQATERGMVPRIAALAAHCRKLGVPVVHCIKKGRPDRGGSFSNSPLTAVSRKGWSGPDGPRRAEIPKELTPEPDDYIVERLHGLTCFHGSELESILRSLDVKTIIMTGVSTNMNIPGTTLEAVNRGFSVVLPEDCTAGASQKVHEFQIAETLKLLTTLTTADDVMSVLSQKER